MAGITPTEKQADTEYTPDTNRINLKGTRLRRDIFKAGAKAEDLEDLGLLKLPQTAHIK